jgi:hypothetical protein
VKRSPYAFPLLVLAVAALVAAGGAVVMGGAARGAIAAGALMGGLFQAAVFAFLVRIFPGRGLAVFGAGMFGHVVFLVLSMFVLVPLTGLAPAPTLLALVTVLFATTTLEPIFLSADNRKNV